MNTGIPGTGIYDRHKIGGGKKSEQTPQITEPQIPLENTFVDKNDAIKTEKAESTTTQGLQELKKMLLDCYQERIELKKEIVKTKSKLTFSTILLVLSYLLIFGFFMKSFRESKKEKKEYLDDLENQIKNCFINIDMEIDDSIKIKFQNLSEKYKLLITCENIWDITSMTFVDQKARRSAASANVTRRLVKFSFGNIDIIKSKFDALHFENANGGDIYIYPAFLAIVDSDKKFGLIDIRELDFSFHDQEFIESEKVPKDAEVIDYTWAKVNKNGTPDKRFKDNYQIPVCKYGEIKLSSSTGLNEAYSFSSFAKSEGFALSMIDYQKTIKK